jgi:NAD(P)-dependent dehydrogenase (short-subunit alcohol dehydrogenase family)
MPSQAGRIALVTGANAGLGFEISVALAAAGATVLLACRNQTKAAEAAEAIRRRVPNAPLELIPLDLSSLTSVAAAAAEVREHHERLDLLINNAGLMAVDESRTADGFEMQIGVNHLGHFALTLDLLPLLLATPGSRVVNMSSMGHRGGRLRLDDINVHHHKYSRWPAYFQSKLANLLFTLELQRRLTESGAGTIALTAHPGASKTDLGSEGTSFTNKLMKPAVPLFSQTAAIGALPLLRAATDPLAVGGEFYGPRWMTRGRPVTETPSRRARRGDDARALWTLSEQLTGRSATNSFGPSSLSM